MSSKSLENYEVLSVIEFGSLGACFKIRDKTSGELFIWKAVDYGSLSESKKQVFLNELKNLSERQHPNIVQCIDYIIHLVSSTVYVVMEWCAGGDLASLVEECKKSGDYLSEDFLWKILYQIGQALNFCQFKSRDNSLLSESVILPNIFLDSDGNAKLGDGDLFQTLQLRNWESEFSVKSSFFNSPDTSKNQNVEPRSEMWALGFLIYQLATLNSASTGLHRMAEHYSSSDDRLNSLPSVYSADLRNILSFLFKEFGHKQPSMKMILHHPTVIKKIKTCLWNSKDFDKFFRKKCTIDPENSRNLNNCHEKHLISLKSVPPCDKKIYSENVSEKTFQEKWLNRIESIRKKEAELKMKDEKLGEKERLLSKREKQVVILEKLAKEKIKRAEIYLKQCREFRVKPKVKNCAFPRVKPDYQVDTSFSADPGDTSILPTTAKIDLDKISELKNFKDTKPDKKERHVSFDKPLPKIPTPDIKIDSENKENIPKRIMFHELMTGQNPPNLKNVNNKVSALSMHGDIRGKSSNKTSTLSLKLDPPLKLDAFHKNFLSKSCSLNKILRKKATCNKQTSL